MSRPARHPDRPPRSLCSGDRRGLTLLELLIALGVVVLVLAAALPTLSHGRIVARRDQCKTHLGEFATAWELYLAGHNECFPVISALPDWHYAGVRFSSVTGKRLPDHGRPLTPYLPLGSGNESGNVFRCPSDSGITGATEGVGTGERTAFRAFGVSYRGNGWLLSGMASDGGTAEPLPRAAIQTAPSRLLLMGDPVWYEVYESTDRVADWHQDPGTGNVLFLDGAVRYMPLRPRERAGPAVVEPRLGPLLPESLPEQLPRQLPDAAPAGVDPAGASAGAEAPLTVDRGARAASGPGT